MDTAAIANFLTTTVTELGIKVLAAIALWIVGRWLIGRVVGLVQAAMNRNSVDANEAMIRVGREAGGPAPTPSSVTKVIQVAA
jgi:hypothetical protein